MLNSTLPSSREAPLPTVKSQWFAVSMLAFGVFVVGTGEFVLAGLLPLLSRSLEISPSVAGQVITTFALTCAIAGPILTTATVRWKRRTVLLAASAVYLLGSAWTALAPSYLQVLLGQVVAALGVGMFVPTATVTAAAMVSPEHRGKAIALVVSGFTAATALGAPLGTAFGGVFGWRSTMWLATGLAAIGVIGVFRFIPGTLNVAAANGLRQQFRLLLEPRILAVLGVTLLAFTAIYMPYTYIGVIFESATQANSFYLAGLMTTLGIVGTIGNLGAGMLADRIGGPKVVILALLWLIAAMLVLPLTTQSLAAAFVMIAFYGIAAFAITTPQQHRLISLKPDAAAVLISLNQAILYLAIALSGSIGGLGIEWVGAVNLGFIAAALAAAALLLSILTRSKPHKPY
ncbi:MFS transporter [Achromobacter sp.]|uniref:MFS transporter n=1 Tax=Achromobacter sp. TaxID=134375 RepID=UPI002F933AF1